MANKNCAISHPRLNERYGEQKIAQFRTHDLTRELYAPQTKILEGGTKDEMRIFEELFRGVSTQFGPRSIEKCFEKPHSSFVPPSKIFVWEGKLAYVSTQQSGQFDTFLFNHFSVHGNLA